MIDRWRELVRKESVSIFAAILRGILFVFSQVYRVISTARNYAYDVGWKNTNRVDIPVVSVGNLTVGGTGKSPTVALIARWFRNRNFRVAIVSRGYGAGRDGMNDEALEMEKLLPDVPHLQNPNRFAAAQVAQEELGTQVILMDDGFQHRRLHRDLEIVLLDATQPFGLGYLLPRGMLRESIRSLQRAHVVILTRSDLVTRQQIAETRLVVQRYAPKAAWVEANHKATALENAAGERLGIDTLAGKRIFAFCGIGNSEAFFETLRKCGAVIVDSVSFPDHHSYTSNDLANIAKSVQRSTADQLESAQDSRMNSTSNPERPTAEIICCTGKDLAKIEVNTIGQIGLWAVKVELQCSFGMEGFDDRLRKIADMIPLDDLD